MKLPRPDGEVMQVSTETPLRAWSPVSAFRRLNQGASANALDHFASEASLSEPTRP